MYRNYRRPGKGWRYKSKIKSVQHRKLDNKVIRKQQEWKEKTDEMKENRITKIFSVTNQKAREQSDNTEKLPIIGHLILNLCKNPSK